MQVFVKYLLELTYCLLLKKLEINKLQTLIKAEEGKTDPSIIIELPHEISNNVVCATSKGSDPAHVQSLC